MWLSLRRQLEGRFLFVGVVFQLSSGEGPGEETGAKESEGVCGKYCGDRLWRPVRECESCTKCQTQPLSLLVDREETDESWQWSIELAVVDGGSIDKSSDRIGGQNALDHHRPNVIDKRYSQVNTFNYITISSHWPHPALPSSPCHNQRHNKLHNRTITQRDLIGPYPPPFPPRTLQRFILRSRSLIVALPCSQIYLSLPL